MPRHDRAEKVVVVCQNANGAPDAYKCTVGVTEEQYCEGDHYVLAIRNAHSDGYEGDMIAFDATDDAARSLVGALKWLTGTYKVMNEPYSAVEVYAGRDKDNCVTGVVAIDLSDILGLSSEAFLDALSTRLVGCDLLQDTSYRVVGSDRDELHVEVCGDVTAVLETTDFVRCSKCGRIWVAGEVPKVLFDCGTGNAHKREACDQCLSDEYLVDVTRGSAKA